MIFESVLLILHFKRKSVTRLDWFTDTGHHLIRMVSLKTGIITSMANNGYPGFGVDGGPVADALLAFPRGVAAIYFADTDNQLIRMVTPGTVKTVRSVEEGARNEEHHTD